MFLLAKSQGSTLRGAWTNLERPNSQPKIISPLHQVYLLTAKILFSTLKRKYETFRPKEAKKQARVQTPKFYILYRSKSL